VEIALGPVASVDSLDTVRRIAWRIAIDGTSDCAAVRGVAVNPCAFGAPLRGFGA
jgi:hypothetical protein